MTDLSRLGIQLNKNGKLYLGEFTPTYNGTGLPVEGVQPVDFTEKTLKAAAQYLSTYGAMALVSAEGEVWKLSCERDRRSEKRLGKVIKTVGHIGSMQA